MKIIYKLLLFLVPLFISLFAVVIYFKLTQKLTTISVPNIPTISFSDLIKFSRFSLEKAPSMSLVGTVTKVEGDVKYMGRLATESAVLSKSRVVQQGEAVTTGADSRLVLDFNKVAEVSLNSNTNVDVIQTLPASLVFIQKTGSVNYKKLATVPVSIRSFHLLTENNGDITLSVSDGKPQVKIEVNSGSATFAYNNLQNETQTLTITAGKTATFNEGTRQMVVGL